MKSPQNLYKAKQDVLFSTNVMSSTAPFICETLQPYHVCTQSQKIGDSSLSAEESAKYQDVAFTSIIPEGITFPLR